MIRDEVADSPSATTILLFTDLVDSTAWKKTLGDRDFAFELRKPHDQLFRDLLARFPGAVERDNAGDGFLATFATPSDAVTLALAFHEALATHNWAEPIKKAKPPVTRIGIHLGEVAQYTDGVSRKVTGQAIDLAARVMGLAAGGRTLLTRHAFDSARQHVQDESLFWANHGKYRFKGDEDDPIEVCEVGVGPAPRSPPSDGEKAKRVLVDPADETGSWRPSAGAAVPRRDGWALESKLGEGGFGEVWLARHARTKQTRVFKFCFDAERLRSFKRELTFFRLIQSELGDRPDFVKLHEVQVEKPPYFLESEYVEAGNLGEWVAKHGGMTPWSLDGRLRFLAETAKAVAAAHSLGIIHKDLKPSNVFVVEDEHGKPRPKLADFGIGVLTDRTLLGRVNITETGFTESVMIGNDSSRTGTRLYTPPESQVGKPATTGTDVYALGVMLFQLVVGDLHRPLGVGWEHSIAADDSDRTALLIEDVTAATHSDSEKRLGAVAQLADRIDRLDVRVTARREARVKVEQERREAERRKRRAFLGVASGTAIVVLALGGGVALWQADSARKEAIRADKGEIAAKEETAKAKGAERAARRQAADVAVNEGVRLYAEGQPLAGQLWFAEALVRNPDDEEYLASHRVRIDLYDRYFPRYKSLAAFFCDANNRFATTVFTPDCWRVVTASVNGGTRVWDAETGKPLTPPLAHNGPVSTASFSPDGRRVVTASMNKTARVWDAQTGKPLTPPLEHKDYVLGASFSPDGRRVVTASSDQSARVWDAETGKPISPPLEHNDQVLSASFSPDGRRVVTASVDKTARVWDVETGKSLTPPLEHENRVMSASFAPDGRRVVTASDDRTARVWDCETGKPLTRPLEHENRVVSASFSPDGRRVVTASETARVWDAETGLPLTRLLIHKGPVVSASFSPDGRRVVTASWDKTARVWDAETGRPLTPYLEHESVVLAAWFAHDGRRIVTATLDMIVRVWDTETGKPLTHLLDHKGSDLSASFAPDGRRVVTASMDKTARVWDTRTGKPLTPPLEHVDQVLSATFAPDGRRVVTASTDHTARVWDAETGKPVTPPLEHQDHVTAASFAPDGRRVVTVSTDKTARVWDAETGKPMTPPLEHQDAVMSVAFSPDGRRVVTASEDKTARIWDAVTGRLLAPPLEHKGPVSTASFAPDGRRVATASESARVWDGETGLPLTPPLEHKDRVASASLSPDGRRVVTASLDRTARVWDAETGKPLAPPLAHKGPVSTASFSPDGRRVVTASWDKTARVWDAETGKPLSPPLEHKDRVVSASFTPDGRRVLTASWDKTVRVWDVTSVERPDADWVKLAQARDCNRIDSTGSIQPLTPEEQRLWWSDVKARYPSELNGPSVAQIKQWYIDRHADADNEQDPIAAAFFLRHLIRLEPDNTTWRIKLTAAEEELRKRQHR